MKKQNRKAFTIVELVIVIAVIAILAAVLIPTFGSIIKKANISADTQMAAALTTELKIHLEGETIDNEEELMTAINAIDPDGKMLVPKALSYDYHFWFDMEGQRIVAMSTEDVEKIGAPEQNEEENVAPDGDGMAYIDVPHRPLLAGGSNDSIFDVNTYAGVRDVFNNKYFLIDSAETIKALFGSLTTITGNTYDDYIANLSSKVEDKVYGGIIAQVIENLKKTIIFNNNGTFYYEGATACNVYFADGIKIIRSNQYVYNGSTCTPAASSTLPTPAKTINLPASVILVEENALNFATAHSVEIQTTCADHEGLSAILSTNCSNAIFLDTAGNKYVVVGNELHLYNGEGNTNYKCDLVKRVPHVDYILGCDDTANLIEWDTPADSTPTLYLSITQSGKATLYVKTEAGVKSYATVNRWISDNPAIIVSSAGIVEFNATDMSVESADRTATIIAETYNINGEKKEFTFNVEIVKPKTASITIDGINHQLDGVDKQITLNYDGSNTYDITLYGLGYSSNSHALGSGKITITTSGAETSMFTVTNNKTLAFDISKTNNEFTVTIDGCLTTKFIVNLNNVTLAEFKHNFYKSATEERPYIIGEGNAVNLAALLSPKGTFAGATVTIYDQLDGNRYYYKNEINKTNNGISAVYPTGTITSATDWANATVSFEIDKNYADYAEGDTYTIYIEIAGSNNVSVIYKFVLAEDAKNVLGSNFKDIGTATSDIVLHGDATNITNATKVDMGNHTLYGNGYKITAKTYRPDTGVLNDYFIKVNGGIIDNIYLEGPVYPWFDYDSAGNRTHVAGVRTEGESTIQHSYLSGFRSPVMCYSGTLDVTNTTLKGGNYGNLVLASGTLNLHDVTTVQDQNGTPDTFSQGKNITGLGIVVEKDAIDGNNEKAYVNITGYLDQYNWVERHQTADMPVVNGIDTKTVFNMLFGVDITIQHKKYYIAGDWVDFKRIQRNIDFVNAYIHEANGKQYVNAGIIFVTMGKKEVIDPIYDNVGNIKVNDNRDLGSGSGSVTPRRLQEQLLPQFSELPIEVSGMSVTASGLMEIVPHIVKEGDRNYYRLSIRNINGITDALKIFSSTDKDVGMKIWSYPNGVSLDSDGYPIEWENGYYYEYGN